MLSLLLAIAMAGMTLTYPKALAHASHGLLSLAMLGVSAGFVHGVGFVPESKLWRFLFGPWLAWALMSLGLWLFLWA
jgi:predicted membrane protein